jgi:ATP-dependent DNA ligase
MRRPWSWLSPLNATPSRLTKLAFVHACRTGLEGVVAKRRDKPYRSGRSPDWIKVKNPDAPAATRVIE